jgi:hypothetical protein
MKQENLLNSAFLKEDVVLSTSDGHFIGAILNIILDERGAIWYKCFC